MNLIVSFALRGAYLMCNIYMCQLVYANVCVEFLKTKFILFGSKSFHASVEKFNSQTFFQFFSKMTKKFQQTRFTLPSLFFKLKTLLTWVEESS